MGSVGSELASSAQLKQFEIGGFESFEVKLEPAVSDDVLWPEMTLFIPTWSETVSDNDSSNPLPNLVLISRLAGECGVSAEKSVAFLCFGSSGCLFLVRTGVREIEETRGGVSGEPSYVVFNLKYGLSVLSIFTFVSFSMNAGSVCDVASKVGVGDLV